MSRMVPIVKREFTQAVTSKAFIIGTVLGPVLLIGIFALQFLIIAKGGGGSQRVAIVDASGSGLAPRVAALVEERAAAGPAFMSRASYQFEMEQAAPADREAVQARLAQRIVDKELDGFLWLPPEALAGTGVRYEGSNATNSQVTADLRQAVQRVVQSERLRQEGIDEARLGNALQPVSMEIARTGDDGTAGSMVAARLLAFGMAFAIYIMVIMYGQSIMTSVQEEKRDRIVELIVSSIRARDLLVGKVLGIGGAGVLQMVIWVAVATLLLTYSAVLGGMLGASEATLQALSQQTMLPRIPLSLAITFVLFFAGGFFLFATLFGVIGAMVTTAQEAQQYVFPILMPFIIGFFISMPAAENPHSTIAVLGSLIPFTSPMVMPVRISVGGLDWVQTVLSLLLLYGTAALAVLVAAKIYRIAIFATGKKPTASEIIRWMRAA
jgi:ABC-2 type transport system permease protein